MLAAKSSSIDPISIDWRRRNSQRADTPDVTFYQQTNLWTPTKRVHTSTLQGQPREHSSRSSIILIARSG
ncbi:hypothetical protein J6590_046937 [Homalodisca vitripennis]|nr:hypothetical protein J6590_046937 [Homalodisca vitripennis]